MRARGLTLVEILLALALLVAVLSLVGPALLGRIAPMTFERTAEQFESVLLLEREEARRTGRARYVYSEPDPFEDEHRVVSRGEPLDEEPTMEGFGLPADPGGGGSPGSAGRDPGGAGAGASSPEERSTTLLSLPERIRIQHEAPEVEGEDELFGRIGGMPGPDPIEPEAEVPMPGGLEGSLGDEPTLILVCLPDGSVVAPTETWLVDRDGRAARLRVDSAIGLVRVVPVERDRTGAGEVLPGGDEVPEAPGVGPGRTAPERSEPAGVTP